MSVGSGDNESVLLLPSDLSMEQPLDMTLFTITHYVLVNASDPRKQIRPVAYHFHDVLKKSYLVNQ